jgi:spermidine/putrescine-binding protein
MVAKAATGNCGYDVVCPSQYAVSDMARQKLLAELDPAALPNFSNLDPRFTKMKADPDGKFAVPYLGASTGVGYRKQALPKPPGSWAELFDPAVLEPLKGRISILDDAREAPAIALLALGLSPNATAEAEIRRAGELLKKQKPYVASYDSEAFEDKLASGSCVLVHGYAGDFVAVMEEDAQLDFYLPAEGSVFNMDCLCVLSESPRRPLAMKFLDFVMRPAIAARISAGTGYPSANAGAMPLLDDSLRRHPCFRIPAGDKLIMLEDPGPKVKDIYTQVWEEVKQA